MGLVASMSIEPELGQVVSVEEVGWRSESWTRKWPSVLLHHEPMALVSTKLGSLGFPLVSRSANRLGKQGRGWDEIKCISRCVTSRARLSS